MSYGKSQAAITYALARLEFDTGFKIGVTCKSTYKRLISQGIPEANLIKMWERVEPELLFVYDEIYKEGLP